jgi:ABC-2 type transport system permease protein
MDLHRLRFVIRKEFRQLRRDPRVVRLAIVAPAIQLLIFGYAATTDLKNAPVAVCDRDPQAASRQLVTKLSQVGYFRVYSVGTDPRRLLEELDHGRAQATLDIPPGFGKKLARGQRPTVQILADGSDSNSATLVLAYLTGTLQAYAAEVQQEAARRPGAAPGPRLEMEPRIWYNPDLRSVNFMLPALVGLILLIITSNFTALSVVREREAGTLEQLIVTPLRPLELLLGKMVPVAVIGLADALLIVALSVAWFRVPLRGSLLLLFALAGGFLFCTLGFGLLISTVSRTQQQAQMINFFLTMPSILLSGFMFPIANMPTWAQWLTYLIPMRYFLVIVRGIYLKGSGLAVLWPQALALSILGLGLLGSGVLLFRKRMD